MKAVGIIAEYNPFHNGHQYQIEEAKRLAKAEYAVVVLNGCFVQRGVLAVTDKYTRTEMALRGGADLVLELPARYGVSSAEFFAFGAVAVLSSLPFVTELCFGSEQGGTELLWEAAGLLADEPEGFQASLQNGLKKGLTYPAARAAAALPYLSGYSPEDVRTCLLSPNNILGIEYLKAIRRLHSPLQVHTVKRKDASYHEPELTGAISSASAIRRACGGDAFPDAIRPCMPPACLAVLEKAWRRRFPMTEPDLSPYLYSRLLLETDFTRYADITPELNRRIRKLLPEYTGFPEFARALKSRQYTRTRINRCLLHILLGIRPFSLSGLPIPRIAPYLRLLGLKKSASGLLRIKRPSVPVITKTADAKGRLSPDGEEMLEEDIRASSLYGYMVYEKFGCRIPDDYRTSPVILP